MAADPYILSHTTWKTVRGTDYEVAILPWGATEAHNYHLPYGTDAYEAAHVAAELRSPHEHVVMHSADGAGAHCHEGAM